MKRHWHSQTVLIHKSIDNTVEKKLQRAWHISPIGRGADYQSIAVSDQFKNPLSIIFGKHTFLFGTAFHTSHTGTHIPTLCVLKINIDAFALSIFLHQF